jgi:hypothetical protein
MILLYQEQFLKAILMAKNTFSVIGGAMPKIDRSALSAAIERASYIDHGPTWRATIAAYCLEIRRLETA